MRVKRGKISIKRRRNILSKVKGYRFGRSTKERMAREAISHAGVYAFNHRRDKKGDFRRLWQTQINAATRAGDAPLSYNRFMASLKKQGVALDRKTLAHLAEKRPEIFDRVIAKAVTR
jgi:large subunit ribosomal protein L20